MDFKKFFSTYSGVMQENRFYRVVCILLLAANLVWGYTALSRKEVVVLVPPHLKDSIRVGMDSADRRYKESWALFFALLLGNVTPQNIEFVVDGIGRYLSPEIYQDLTKEIYAQAKSVKQSHLSVSFEPREVAYDQENDRVLVKGLTRLQGTFGKTQTAPKGFEFGIDVKGYQPLITHLDIYETRPEKTGRDQKDEDQHDQKAEKAGEIEKDN